MSSGKQPSRALLIAAGVLTQSIGVSCLVLGLVSIPVVADLNTGMGGLIASLIAALAAIVCGTLVWRGRLVPLALAIGLDVGFGIGFARGGSALGAMLRILPSDDAQTAESLIVAIAITMFAAAILCVLAVPSALELRRWAPTRERPRLSGQHAGGTLPGLGAEPRLMPTEVLRVPASRVKPALVIGVAITLIALGVIVISAASGSKPDLVASSGPGSAAVGSLISGSAGSAAVERDGGAVAESADGGGPVVVPSSVTPDAGVAPPSIGEVVARFHAALETGAAAELALLFDDKAFAIGVQANDVAEGRDAVVAQLRDDVGGNAGAVTVKYSHTGQDGDVAWLAEELRIGATTFVATAVFGVRDGAWTIAALHWAQAMPNATAYRLAREGELAIPDAIPNTNDQSALANAMRAAFASKPSFVDARSARADAFNFGSAPGERLKGGEAIKNIFSRIAATVRVRDAVKVGMTGERGGWGVANVEFTDTDKDGTEVTQTFRVLAAWVKEDAGWRIVQTQWSNPR